MKTIKALTIATLSFALLSSCSEAQYASHVIKQIPMTGDRGTNNAHYKVGKPYKIAGTRYYPKERFRYSETGIASWYGPNFDGKQTANGEIFDKNELTAAHKTLQLPSIIRVTNLRNGRSLVLRVNDRGPYSKNRILDVSERAAELLGFKSQGTTKIKIEVMGQASREVASMAKRNIDTTGYEVALNQNKIHTNRRAHYVANSNQTAIASHRVIPKPIRNASVENQNLGNISPSANNYISAPKAKPQYEPITTVQIPPKTPNVKSSGNHAEIQIAGISPQSSTAPTPPLLKPSNFYIQAGAFREEKNAINLSNALSSHGNSKVYLSRTNNAPTFKVKLGPYNSNEEAMSALNSLQASGKNGIVVAE